MTHLSSIPAADWQDVPARVERLLSKSLPVKQAHERAADIAGLLAISAATFDPDGMLTVWLPELPGEKTAAAYEKALATTDYTVSYRTFEDNGPDWHNEVLLKVGSFVPGLPTVWNGANKLLMGPTPLSQGIVSGLLAGGLGYGAGALAEHLFPERYIQRGKLRRTLGLLGALGGVAVAGTGGYANARALRKGFFGGLMTNNKTPVVYPYEQKQLEALEKQSFYPPLGKPPGLPPMPSPLYAPTISVPQFNAAAWNDVQMGMHRGFQSHTPPQYAAATTGLMSGLATMNRSPIISPATVINGIASAGVGLATATVAGKALSALAGLTPAGQQKLQDMGMWGGMMHAIVPAVFGGR
jgi:hypothetical protein